MHGSPGKHHAFGTAGNAAKKKAHARALEVLGHISGGMRDERMKKHMPQAPPAGPVPAAAEPDGDEASGLSPEELAELQRHRGA